MEKVISPVSVSDFLTWTSRQAQTTLRRELGRAPTAGEIAERVIRAIDYTQRCNDAVVAGLLAPQADDLRLLVKAGGFARSFAQRKDFEQFTKLITDALKTSRVTDDREMP